MERQIKQNPQNPNHSFKCQTLYNKVTHSDKSNHPDSILALQKMDFFFQDKNAPAQLSSHTRDLIELIGETKNKQTQQQIIKRQMQAVKQTLQHPIDLVQLPDILVRLIYFETMGYDTSFAHILPINYCQQQDLYIKKLSYLLAAMLVKPGDQLQLLMNNTIMKDLQSENIFVTMIALTMIRYFAVADNIDTFLPFVLKLTKSKTSVLRKKSLLVLYNFHQVDHKYVVNIKNLALEALNDTDTSVVFTGSFILKMLVMANPHAHKDIVKPICQVLMKIVDHKYPHEYDYHRIPAPWQQIQILKMLQKLGKNDQTSSGLMYDVLDKVMRRCTHFSMHFNNGILLQAIKTISNIYPHTYLIQCCHESLYKFFDSSNSNMRYFGITAMIEILKVNKQCVDRWQFVLLECLENDDITLAEKTIELLTIMANEENTELILARIIKLTSKSVDQTEKRNLIKKGIYLIEKFSSNREIFLRRMNEIFYKFQAFISHTSVNNFLKVILEIAQIEPDFIDMALDTYIEIVQNFRNNVLLRVSGWVIGEFGSKIYERDHDQSKVDRAVQAILSCAQQYLNDEQITFLLVSALMKLSGKNMTSKHEQIKKYLLKVQGNYNYFIHKTGQEFIRMAKYSRALTSNNEIMVSQNLLFLVDYMEKNNQFDPDKEFLVSRKNTKKISEIEIYNDCQSQDNHDLKSSNLFEFKPGARWGHVQTQSMSPKKMSQQQSMAKKKQEQVKKQNQKEKLTLRGPRQGKVAKNPVDIKKANLAKSLFGKKK